MAIATHPQQTSRPVEAKYKVHRFDLHMTRDQGELEGFLNGLEGEVVAIVPNVVASLVAPRGPVNFVLVVERLTAEAA